MKSSKFSSTQNLFRKQNQDNHTNLIPKFSQSPTTTSYTKSSKVTAGSRNSCTTSEKTNTEAQSSGKCKRESHYGSRSICGNENIRCHEIIRSNNQKTSNQLVQPVRTNKNHILGQVSRTRQTSRDGLSNKCLNTSKYNHGLKHQKSSSIPPSQSIHRNLLVHPNHINTKAYTSCQVPKSGQTPYSDISSIQYSNSCNVKKYKDHLKQQKLQTWKYRNDSSQIKQALSDKPKHKLFTRFEDNQKNGSNIKPIGNQITYSTPLNHSAPKIIKKEKKTPMSDTCLNYKPYLTTLSVDYINPNLKATNLQDLKKLHKQYTTVSKNKSKARSRKVRKPLSPLKLCNETKFSQHIMKKIKPFLDYQHLLSNKCTECLRKCYCANKAQYEHSKQSENNCKDASYEYEKTLNRARTILNFKTSSEHLPSDDDTMKGASHDEKIETRNYASYSCECVHKTPFGENRNIPSTDRLHDETCSCYYTDEKTAKSKYENELKSINSKSICHSNQIRSQSNYRNIKDINCGYHSHQNCSNQKSNRYRYKHENEAGHMQIDPNNCHLKIGNKSKYCKEENTYSRHQNYTNQTSGRSKYKNEKNELKNVYSEFSNQSKYANSNRSSYGFNRNKNKYNFDNENTSNTNVRHTDFETISNTYLCKKEPLLEYNHKSEDSSFNNCPLHGIAKFRNENYDETHEDENSSLSCENTQDEFILDERLFPIQLKKHYKSINRQKSDRQQSLKEDYLSRFEKGICKKDKHERDSIVTLKPINSFCKTQMELNEVPRKPIHSFINSKSMLYEKVASLIPNPTDSIALKFQKKTM